MPNIISCQTRIGPFHQMCVLLLLTQHCIERRNMACVLLYAAPICNIPQIRVTSYATTDVNNKIGLYMENQLQIILINVIENRYFHTSNIIKLGPFNTPDLLTYNYHLIKRLCSHHSKWTFQSKTVLRTF